MSAHGRRSYRPGGWFGIFGDAATLLLPPTEKHRVAALWELVDAGAGFDVVLDALLSTGLRDLPGFVLVSPVEQGAKVVLRGAVAASFDAAGERVEVSGSRDTTWVERSLAGVTRMVVEVEPSEDGAEELTIGTGLVRLARLEEPPPVREPDVAAAHEDTAADEGRTADEGVDEDEDDGADADADVDEDDGADWDVPADALAVADESEGGEERAGWDTEQDGDPEPWVEAAPAPPDQLPVVARLVLADGQVVPVDRMVLIGRAPEPRLYTLTEEPTLVQVPSPYKEISATHLEVRPGTGQDRGLAVATDLGSTNGTLLVQPGLQPEELHPGVSVPLLPGAVIDLGDGMTIQVEAG